MEATVNVLRRGAAESAAKYESLRERMRSVQAENVRLRLNNELSGMPRDTGVLPDTPSVPL